jgi:hypothetical protein
MSGSEANHGSTSLESGVRVVQGNVDGNGDERTGDALDLPVLSRVVDHASDASLPRRPI